ncbi:hypothetical protein JCM10212_000029 [Sporobolomyces blumeae]
MGLFDGSIGAFVIGTTLSTFLLGITSCQALRYFQLFPNDKRLYWWLVVFLVMLDWAHSAVCMYTIYDWTVVHYGEVEHLLRSPFSFAVDPAMTGVAAFACQVFYAYRVYVVGKRSPWLPILICVLALVSLGFAVGATAEIFILQEFSKFQSYTWGVSLWLAAAALADIIITASLVAYLAKSKTGLLQTNSILNRLIELIISTNGLTAAVALIDAVLFGALSSSWHVAPNLCLVKLYLNSLLVSLNARAELERYLSGGRGGHDRASHPLNHLSPSLGLNSGSAAGGVGGSSTHTARHTDHVVRPDPDVKTALGFGAEDCNPAVFYQARQVQAHGANGGAAAIAEGIRVTTHQTVTTDHPSQDAAYPPHLLSRSTRSAETGKGADDSFDEKNNSIGTLTSALSHGFENIQHARVGVTIEVRCLVAWLAVFVWDWLSTLPEEYEHVWKQRLTTLKVLFLFNRYGTLAFQALIVYMVQATVSQETCRSMFWVQPLSGVLILVVCTWILSLRVYAMFERRRTVKIGLIVLVAVQATSMLVGAVQLRPLVLAAFVQDLVEMHGCAAVARAGLKGRLIALVWIAPLVADAIVLALAVFRMRQVVKRAQTNWEESACEETQSSTGGQILPLFRRLVRDGCGYFVVVTIMNAVTIALYAQSNAAIKAAKNPGNTAFSSMMCSRLVLSLFSVPRSPPTTSLQLSTRRSSPSRASNGPPRLAFTPSVSSRLSIPGLSTRGAPRLKVGEIRVVREQSQRTDSPSPERDRRAPAILLTPPSSSCKIVVTPPPSPRNDTTMLASSNERHSADLIRSVIASLTPTRLSRPESLSVSALRLRST